MTSRPGMDWREKRAFNFFQNRTAEELGGYFSAELWSKFVLITAHHEDAIKHAVIAIGALHEVFLGPSHSTDPYLLAFAMQHYGRAMQHVVKLDTSTSARAVDVALTVSVLFACIEIFKKHFVSALNHIYSGMKILAELARRPQASSEHYLPRNLLVQMYLRLDTQVMELGEDGFQIPPTFAITAPTPVPEVFLDTETARSCLEMCRYQTMHFVHDIENAKDKSEVLGESLKGFHQRYHELRQHFNRWKHAFDYMLRGNRNQTVAVLILQTSAISLDIILWTSLQRNEMVFDLFTNEFREIVAIAEEVVGRMRQDARLRSSSPSLQISFENNLQGNDFSISRSHVVPIVSMNVGIVLHLYMTATRCREPNVRRNALDLLKTIKRREGICDSDMMAACAEELIFTEEIEARGRLQSMGNGSVGLVSSKQVPESVRIRASELCLSDLNGIQMGSKRKVSTFSTR